jgi:hypothetical protein
MSICPPSEFPEVEGWDFAVVQVLATVGVAVPSAPGLAPLVLLLSPITYNCQVQDINYICIKGFIEYTNAEGKVERKILLFSVLPSINTGCFEKRFETLKAYINLFRGHVRSFELS